jgi:SAM-dependent methyltransferase
LRFTQLLRLVEGEADAEIIDYGCGYGALARRLIESGGSFRYIGFDACEPMVEAARAAVDDPRCRFTSDEAQLGIADFTLASGIFSVRLGASEADWHEHVVATLERFARLSHRGFAFNMLTRYADPPLMRGDLYYANPERYFALCKQSHSRHVALLHDYDLYEFTLIVRKGAEPTALAPPDHVTAP